MHTAINGQVNRASTDLVLKDYECAVNEPPSFDPRAHALPDQERIVLDRNLQPVGTILKNSTYAHAFTCYD